VTGPGVLALAPRHTSTAGLLADAARRRGMTVVTLGGPAALERLSGRPDVHYFGGPSFARRVREPLGLALLEPPDDWLPTLPHAYTGRAIRRATLAEARRLTGPAFVKQPREKDLPAAVYATGRDLPGTRLPPGTPVLISDVVGWAEEVRLFVLDGEIRTGSRYATRGILDPAPLSPATTAAATRLLAGLAPTLPSAVVLDIGLLDGAGPRWAVVEANMAWFSTCYAADPSRALDVVTRAAGPRAHLRPRDRPFST
jgi:hypothetical protein